MKLSVLLSFVLSVAGLTACSDEISSNSIVPSNEEFSIQMTTPVPNEFFAEANLKGTVELLEYESKDYTRGNQPATHKPAYVYLPYGYDTAKQYDIIYLLHGWTGVAEEYFYGRDGNDRHLVNLFDNMIEHGLCKPFIAVSPTWDKDNRPKDWSESCREAAVFAQEYVNDLIPAVESHYSTYATTTDEAGILASRGHRALGGFSLGSITTWYVFEQAFPYSRWYLPMSGDNWSQGMFGGQYYPEATARFLADLVNASPYGKGKPGDGDLKGDGHGRAQRHLQRLQLLLPPETGRTARPQRRVGVLLQRAAVFLPKTQVITNESTADDIDAISCLDGMLQG